MRIEADSRLAAAAGGAARYLADAAGLEGPALTEWQAAIVAACNEALAQPETHESGLDVTFTRLSDRIEVSLSRKGQTGPAVGLDVLSGFAPGVSGSQGKGKSRVLGGVDRVQYETTGGMSVTRLTKFIAPTSPLC